MQCGKPANRTQRITKSTERVVVGASEVYEARCRHCFDPQEPIEHGTVDAKTATERKGELHGS
jgi:thymidine kinase